MLHFDLDGQYADALEQALFNNVLCGLSRDGEHYFYSNPLENDGSHSRWAWHTCPCCTMNVSRLIASVGGYFVSHSDDAIAFHLYGGIATSVELKTGKVGLREISNYPWSGDIAIEVDPETPAVFTLKLRIPGWSKGARVAVNGQPVDAAGADKGYLDIKRQWSKGDRITLELPMPAERIYAHPSVRMDVGRVALRRGPLVYCLEEADNPGGTVQRFRLPRTAELRTSTRSDLFGGAVTITAAALALEDGDWRHELYRTAPPSETKAELTALPYYLWNNRERGSMLVWVPEA
jgi:hypothetical protein